MLGVSKQFVLTWTRSLDQDVREDHRGWAKGQRHRWSQQTEQRITRIHHFLTTNTRQFYCGATAIEHEWRQRYNVPPPPLRTIGQLLSDLHLSQPRRHERTKGAARYLCYPEHTIYEQFGGRVLEADFIGKKYLTGTSEPLHFIGFAFKKAPRLRYFQRIAAQTTDAFIHHCEQFFMRFEKPMFVKVDNCAATIGSASGKRNLSKAMLFLFANKIIPIFSVPRQPFSQASIEGNNSVFARKFWHKFAFRNPKDVDTKLAWFNDASLAYTQYRTPPPCAAATSFVPKVYFLRQVKELAETNKAFIDVLHENIVLPASYINYFVLAEWNIETERLSVFFEQQLQSKIIHQQRFFVNQHSKKSYLSPV